MSVERVLKHLEVSISVLLKFEGEIAERLAAEMRSTSSTISSIQTRLRSEGFTVTSFEDFWRSANEGDRQSIATAIDAISVASDALGIVGSKTAGKILDKAALFLKSTWVGSFVAESLMGDYGIPLILEPIGFDITGTKLNDLIAGSDKTDVISGLGGDDQLVGLRRRDTLFGGIGSDSIFGGDGDDSLVGDGGEDEIFGGNDDDSIFGASDNDTLYGGEGSDTINGSEGNDRLHGGDDRDRLIGGTNDDTLFGEEGTDSLFGEDGNDSLFGGADGGDLYGGLGDDTLYGDEGRDSLFGGDGNDSLIGSTDSGKLFGGLGDDTLFSEGGRDSLFGEDGNDSLIGGADGGKLYGGLGDDYLIGGVGRDSLYGDEEGEDGNDTLAADSQDMAFGGNGDDVILIDGDVKFADGGAGEDHFVFMTTSVDKARIDADLSDKLLFSTGFDNAAFFWVFGGKVSLLVFDMGQPMHGLSDAVSKIRVDGEVGSFVLAAWAESEALDDGTPYEDAMEVLFGQNVIGLDYRSPVAD